LKLVEFLVEQYGEEVLYLKHYLSFLICSD